MKGAVFRDRGVLLGESLVLADPHVGRDEASSVEFPLGERDDLAGRLVALVDHFDPAEVVVAGDVLHTFSRASTESRGSLRDLTDVCREAGARPVLVAGNHDTVLGEVWDGDVHDHYALGEGTVVCHGHEEPAVDAERYVVGHDHPVIVVEGQRHPCFLYGERQYGDAELLMLPAFNRLAAGVEVNGMYARDFQSPLVTDADALEPVVYDADSQETLRFPPLGEFRRML